MAIQRPSYISILDLFCMLYVICYSAAAITSEEASDAMLDFVSQKCCYGSDPAKEMVIRDIKPSSAYHVRIHISLIFKIKIL